MHFAFIHALCFVIAAQVESLMLQSIYMFHV